MSENKADEIALWVFGYGSLIWHPEIDFVSRRIAALPGYHRSFCMKSVHHRGTDALPGLVLALDAQPGANCSGIAFGVRDEAVTATLETLRARELISSAYLERFLDIRLDDERVVNAVTYVIDPEHEQYCGGLPLETQARMIAQAHGGRGPNREYLANTAARVRHLGLGAAELDWLEARVAELPG